MSRSFRRLWCVALLDSLAGWAAQVALTLGVLAGHSGSTLAWMLLAGNVPSLLAGLLGGAAADRVEPRLLARIALPLRALALLATGTTIAHSLPAAAVGYAVFTVSGRFAGPALQRLRYAALPEHRWAAGNAAIGTATGITTIVGAAAGAVGTAGLGPATTFTLAAGLSLVTVALVWPVRPDRGAHRTARGAGFVALRRYPAAAGVIGVGLAWGLIGGGYDVLLGVVATHTLGGGAGLGLLYAADGVGVLVGTLVAGRLGAGRRRFAFAAAYLVQGVLWAGVGLSPALLVAAAVLLVMRAASGVIIGLDTTLLLETVPRELHARVFSLHNTSYGLLQRVSLSLTGALLPAAGANALVVAGGVGSVLVGVVWWLSVGRRPAPVPVPPPSRSST